ncbi:hypothetical protein KYI13_12675 (plasmid) [Macrococcoides bohemicum]|uniref:hypothetical protein n=1 Tax=Macrococcoides bohemicum TaxID=1903056 RepID=UPI001C5E0171|nr:hypothetical protein [Macrococcus bohemicus]QYA46036.1 hypothetical protein KYI13_12675 [Macrococcus bohemicus]
MLKSYDKEKAHLIEWISIINCLNTDEKKQLDNKNKSDLETMYRLALLQVQDESLQ